MKKTRVSKYTREDAIENARYVFDKCGKFTKQSNKDLGSISDIVYIRIFGSWNSCLKELGMPVNSARGISEELIVEDMSRLQAKYGRLTKDLYSSEGKYGASTVKRIFGSWNKALIKIGIELNCEVNIPDESLLENLKQLHKEHGTISTSIIRLSGKYSPTVYMERFGAINNAIELAGLPINNIYGFSNVAHATISRFEDIMGESAEREKQFDWLVNPKTGRKLFVDAYFPNSRIAVEYNGEQHYNQRAFSRTEESFEKGRYRDKIKANLLEKHGIRLIVVKYDEPISVEYLKSKLCV